MNTKVLNAMKNDYRLSKEYLDGFMSTIENGNQNVAKNQSILSKINASEIIKKSEEVFALTHSSQSPIYASEEDKFMAKEMRKSKAYNRAKENKKANRIIEEQLRDEELDSLTF